MIPELTVEQLKEELGSQNPPTLIDVREDEELEISRFPAYVHIPLMSLPDHVNTLDRDANLVIVCRTGNRSGRAVLYLRQLGFGNVRNLVGGINDWVRKFDPEQPLY